MNVNPVTRKALECEAEDCNPPSPVIVIIVWPIPAPCNVTFFVMSTFDQDHEPAGQTSVSPGDAAEMALLTVDCSQLPRFVVAALAIPETRKDAMIKPIIFLMAILRPPARGKPIMYCDVHVISPATAMPYQVLS